MTEIPPSYLVDQKDYDPALGSRLVVTVDGVDQRGRVAAYGIEAETLTRCKHDQRGCAYVAPGADKVAMETVHGVINVTLKAEGE